VTTGSPLGPSPSGRQHSRKQYN